MGILIGCIYVVIGVIMFLVTLKLHAKDEHLYKDDLSMHFFIFGVLWFIGLMVIIFDLLGSLGNDISARLLKWANK